MITTETITSARNVEKKHGTSYYIATLFFPQEIKNAVFILYAFVRTPDEFVDNPLPNTNPQSEIAQWKEHWIRAYKGDFTDNTLLNATADIFKRYSIPFDLSIAFIDAMMRDTTQSRYTTYTDLQSYMYGSAEVVGLMLTYIIGYTDPHAFTYARKLGEAMQLTNFLRDIEEDYTQRNRIYLPLEDMNRYHVTEEMIHSKKVTPEFIDLMKYEIARARQLFREADHGIPLLSQKGQLAVKLASRLYEKILDKIEHEHYDIFHKRVRSTTLEKIWLITKTYASH